MDKQTIDEQMTECQVHQINKQMTFRKNNDTNDTKNKRMIEQTINRRKDR